MISFRFLEKSAISLMPSTTDSIELAASFATLFPLETSLMEASIRSLVSTVALALWSASSLIWLATTAKPRPDSPARAASMVAFRDRRLVWSAMDSISEMISPILVEDSLILSMAAIMVSICWRLVSASSAYFCALS